MSYLITKNSMLAGNVAANLTGYLIFLIIKNFAVAASTSQADAILLSIRLFYLPGALIALILMTVYYERPIRTYLKKNLLGDRIDQILETKARQRVLNEPFYLLILDLAIWLIAGFLCLIILRSSGVTGSLLIRIFCQISLSGAIITTIAFFILERILKIKLVPILFPNGGLYKTPKTLRIRIRTRLIALLAGINIIPLVAFFLMSMATTQANNLSQPELLSIFRRAIQFNIAAFMAMAIVMVFLVSSSLTKPFAEIINRLQKIRKGDFEGDIKVSSNDEIGYASDVINEMAAGLKDREFIKEIFGRYVTKEIRDEILSGNIPLDGEQKEVTVLFSDLRGFTPMIETLGPKKAVKVMNLYFKEMAGAIQENAGLVLQYIGDEIYAVFGAPVSDRKHPIHAVKAAIAMQDRLVKLNRNFKNDNLPRLEHGIGIHTGKVLAANMGSPDRMSYLLVGNTVNIASRLQGLNKEFKTSSMLSQHTYNGLDGSSLPGAKFVDMGNASLKGINEKIHVFSLSIEAV